MWVMVGVDELVAGCETRRVLPSTFDKHGQIPRKPKITSYYYRDLHLCQNIYTRNKTSSSKIHLLSAYSKTSILFALIVSHAQAMHSITDRKGAFRIIPNNLLSSSLSIVQALQSPGVR